MNARAELGRAGEDLAVDLYRRCGFAVLERNYRCSLGEIDLVVRRGGLLVFCEVKARRTDFFGSPAEAVGWSKQTRLRRLAARWMSERRPGRVEVRFDVVAIVFGESGTDVTHISGAF